MPRPLDQSQVDRIKELKAQGLSNSQISIEMGLSTMTVRKYLGNQKLMSRAKYGSIVSHIIGDSFVKGMDGMAKKVENPGLSVDTVKVHGAYFTYKIELEQGITILRNMESIYISKDRLSDFVKEVAWLAECLSQDKLPL